MAVSAYGGALGLIFGFLNLGTTVTHRLPFQSPVLGGIALTVIVAVPCTVLAVLAAGGHQVASRAATLVGGLIVCWILIELAFIREVSFFHPVYVAIGLALVWLGARRPHPPSSARVQ